MESGNRELKQTQMNRLKDMKLMLAKVLEEKETCEDLRKETMAQLRKKVNCLKSVISSQDAKRDDLELQMKTTEKKTKVKKEMLETMKEEEEKKEKEFRQRIDKYWEAYNETISQLEEEVRKEHVEYQAEREKKILLGTVNGKMSEETRKPVHAKIMRKKKEMADKRERDFQEANQKLEADMKSSLKAVRDLEKRKDLLQQQHRTLREILVMSERARESAKAS